MNSVDMANDLINRAKNLKPFEVKRMLDNGINFTGGPIPFDLRMNEDCLWVKVYALTAEEAEAQVDIWLQDKV